MSALFLLTPPGLVLFGFVLGHLVTVAVMR